MRHRRPQSLTAVIDDLLLGEKTSTTIAAANVVGVVVWEQGGRILEANENFLRLLGLDRGSLTSGALDWTSLTPPEYRPLDAAKIVELNANGVHSPYEKELLRRDGTRVYVLVASAYSDASRAYGVAVVVDHTAARAADAERRRIQEANEILAQASAVLGRSLDMRATAEAIARAALPKFADWAVVDSIDAAGKLGRLALAHIDPKLVDAALEIDRRWPPKFDDTSGVHAVARTGTPLLLAEIRDEDFALLARDAEHFAAWQAFNVRSCVSVPLQAGDETLGVLTLFRGEGGKRFTADDLPLALELGRRAATALVNARLFEREREARAEAEAARMRTDLLQRLSAALTPVLTRNDVTDVVLTHLVGALGAVAGGVMDLSPHGDELLLRGAVGIDPVSRHRFARVGLDAPLPASVVARTRQAMFISDRDEWTASFGVAPPRMPEDLGRAWAALPLLVEDRILGVMTLTLQGPRVFSEDERRLLRAFADLCAQALERARLYEAEQEARALAERLQEITTVLVQATTLGDVADTVIRATIVAMQADSVALVLRDPPPADNWARIVRAFGLPPDVISEFTRFPLDGSGVTSIVLRSGEPLIVERRDGPNGLDARFGQLSNLWERLGTQALVTVPLTLAERVIGALSVTFNQRRVFSESDRAFFAGLVRQTAHAIERVQLLERERSAHADADSARAAAVHANQAKSQFLATMSHELRTPLNAIGGYVDLLTMGIRGPLLPQQLEDLSRINHNQQHLLSLINEVLNYARLEAGSVRYDVTQVGVSGILATFESLILPQLRSKQLSLVVEPVEPTLQVRADPEKLRQILLNLLSNAIKFTPAGGRIRVLADSHTARRVTITVEDTGIGIAADHLEWIFEPFVQIGRALHAPIEGSGLGLAISRDLARGMNGDLTVESTVGVGSAFRLTLPSA
ncbi:MAG TPA: GAF domain-containing protein [Gemmatimonadaceae bacterium]